MPDPTSATRESPAPSAGSDDEAVTYDPVEFDPEETFVDDDVDLETLALRDAMRDILASEGRVELLM
jgi:hypothetical protein